nr:MAG TPA: hypothetical protein [Caudoviricetes sp.]
MDFYYSRDDLLEDLSNPKFNYYINDEKEGLINQEIIDGFDYFYENNKVKKPSKLMAESTLSDYVLEQLNCVYNDLEFLEGIFLIKNYINNSENKVGYISNNDLLSLNREKYEKTIRKNCIIDINKKFKSKSYQFHDADSIPNALLKAEHIQPLNKGHKEFVTNWVNTGNHKFEDVGLTQTVINNGLLNITNSNICYSAKYIKEPGESKPRGIFIQARIEKGDFKSIHPQFEDRLDIFIPNIDSRFKVCYR